MTLKLYKKMLIEKKHNLVFNEGQQFGIHANTPT